MPGAHQQPEPGETGTRRIDWQWRAAALGAVDAAPAAAVTAAVAVPSGVALAVGVLPAAIMGLPPTRRARAALILIGILTGLPMVLGSLVAHTPLLAIVVVFTLAVGAAALARTTVAKRRNLGRVLSTLSVPLVGVGLSYDDPATAVGLAVLMIGGSVFAYVVSLLLPEHAAVAPVRPGTAITLGYGVRLGAAGATAAAIGFTLDLDHVGWACAAALLVMRPDTDEQVTRMAGRIASMLIGGTAAVLVVGATPADWVYSAAVVAVVATAAATHRSRWYVTSTFTTFLVFVLLLYSDPEQAGYRFTERLSETVLGVAIAFLFGIAVPALGRRTQSSR
ncbi:FUSC family protein [Rhodococcus sp. ACS1]|uniref:FUSC family protein n=1 Tax=Rhodococcus sp. ACS1 TaxID=2028570 RepID=UPI000BB135FF|nr:FUSC family protein [Rhodococcus sp. ACS1]PBC45896.1 FUSC family protein [Rhodococcus sp. ACS1]